jgi:Pyruvate/2-oxoacid:ferredoxin oxidoreductase delta subunit
VVEIVSEAPEQFAVGSFYGRLGVFAVGQPDEYLALPPETRKALDAWCFETYLESLGDDELPSSDRVLTVEQVLEHIDSVDRAIWLNRCDCRTLAGECDKPTDTCITFKSGVNTLSHRGWSLPLTKAEAKAVVVRAHAAGLVHTVNDNGICNCCSECCYLFRAQAARASVDTWPVAELVAVRDDAACTACCVCVKRCPFGVFELADGRIVQRQELCRGCGVCIESCRASAIAMRPKLRTPAEATPANPR